MKIILNSNMNMIFRAIRSYPRMSVRIQGKSRQKDRGSGGYRRQESDTTVIQQTQLRQITAHELQLETRRLQHTDEGKLLPSIVLALKRLGWIEVKSENSPRGHPGPRV